MARVLCAYSGVDFKVEHMMIYNTSRESHHPIFDLPTNELLTLQDKYYEGNFTNTDNYLYYLALLKTTELVEFRVPAIQTTLTQSIIANTMRSLLNMVHRIHILNDNIINKINLPRFVLTPDTKDLSNTKYWLQLWEQNYTDYLSGYKSTNTIQALNYYESQLEKKIKDKCDPAQYGALLANWAALAGNFHTDIIWNERNEDEVAAEYWKRIIRIAAKGDSIFHIPMEDINDVILTCEESVFMGDGAIQAHILMRLLREAKERKHNYLSLGDMNISGAFKILDADSSTEDANMLALILSAPKSEPRESEYPNRLAFRLAKIKYAQAQAYYTEHPSERPVNLGFKKEDNMRNDPTEISSSVDDIGQDILDSDVPNVDEDGKEVM